MNISSSISIWNNNFSVFAGGGGSYLVDDYSPLVAYSLRKVSSTATNCIRVRRSSDNTEQDIGFSGDGLDTSALTTFVGANDGFIVKWYDQSGNINDASQATASQQQRIVNSGVVEVDPSNGLPAANPNGTNKEYSLTTNITTTQILAQAWVFNRGGTTWNVSLGTTTSTPFTMVWSFADAVRVALNTSTISDNDTTTGDILSFMLRDSSNNVKYWLNNSAGTTKTHTATGSTLNRLFKGNGINHDDPVQELIYWNTDVESDRVAIQDNINDYYTIY